jgi:hypothetical protein
MVQHSSIGAWVHRRWGVLARVVAALAVAVVPIGLLTGGEALLPSLSTAMESTGLQPSGVAVSLRELGRVEATTVILRGYQSAQLESTKNES